MNIIGKLPGLGDIAEKVLDSLLPKELSCVGDLVGGFINFQSGNFAGAARNGLELFGDMKDLAQFLGKSALVADGQSAKWCYEPPPPVSRAQQTPIEPAQPEQALRVAPQALPSGWRGSPPPATKTTDGKSTTSAKKPLQPKETTAKAAKPTETKETKQTKETKTPKEATKPKETAAPKETKTTTTESKKSGNVVEDFFKKSPDDFMKAIRDGKIPDEIKDSPTEMRRLQAKMDQITEMNHLMTSLMQALHQMRMAVIQNVRV